MRRGNPAQGGRLLCLVLIWDGSLPAGADGRRVLRMTWAQRVNLRLSGFPTWPLYLAGALPPAVPGLSPWHAVQAARASGTAAAA